MKKQPIDVLDNNIMNFFENANSYIFKKHLISVKNKLINPEIIFDCSNNVIKFPDVLLKEKQIRIQKTYLSHLWSFAYSILVINEEAIQKKMLNETFDGQIDFDSELLIRSKKLLDWSLSLNNRYSNWDSSLPNPDTDYKRDTKEVVYIKKTNNLYQIMVSFLLYHEFNHLVNGHNSYWSKEYKEEELYDLIEIEKEADLEALAILVDLNSESRVERGLAILLLFCSNILLSNKYNLHQKKHPDIDQRLEILFSHLTFENKENEFYFWYLGCFILNLFLSKEGIPIEKEKFEDAKECFYYYSNLLKKQKENFDL